MLTALGRDELAAEVKQEAERSEREAKEKDDRDVKDKSERRVARRSWAQWGLGYLIQLIIGLVGVIVGAVIQARTDIASWFLKLLGL